MSEEEQTQVSVDEQRLNVIYEAIIYYLNTSKQCIQERHETDQKSKKREV
jgi:hypothetical protein